MAVGRLTDEFQRSRGHDFLRHTPGGFVLGHNGIASSAGALQRGQQTFACARLQAIGPARRGNGISTGPHYQSTCDLCSEWAAHSGNPPTSQASAGFRSRGGVDRTSADFIPERASFYFRSAYKTRRKPSLGWHNLMGVGYRFCSRGRAIGSGWQGAAPISGNGAAPPKEKAFIEK